jgi:hypothetical protein
MISQKIRFLPVLNDIKNSINNINNNNKTNLHKYIINKNITDAEKKLLECVDKEHEFNEKLNYIHYFLQQHNLYISYLTNIQDSFYISLIYFEFNNNISQKINIKNIFFSYLLKHENEYVYDNYTCKNIKLSDLIKNKLLCDIIDYKTMCLTIITNDNIHVIDTNLLIIITSLIMNIKFIIYDENMNTTIIDYSYKPKHDINNIIVAKHAKTRHLLLINETHYFPLENGIVLEPLISSKYISKLLNNIYDLKKN